jgi:hypothetical protein
VINIKEKEINIKKKISAKNLPYKVYPSSVKHFNTRHSLNVKELDRISTTMKFLKD